MQSKQGTVLFLDGYQASRQFPNREIRIRDVEVARKLGLSSWKMRELIARNAEELSDFGVLCKMGETPGPKGGRPTGAYWLNRDQALLLCMWSNSKAARAVRKELVAVFNAYVEGADAPLRHRSYIAEVLRLDAAGEWEKMWPNKFVHAVCKLKRKPFTGRQPGKWMSRVYADLYDLLLGKDVYDVVKGLNPKPTHGSNHHQRLREAARQRVQEEIQTITALANTSNSFADFMAKLRHCYASAPLQLTMPGG
jgi:hypothetical protein